MKTIRPAELSDEDLEKSITEVRSYYRDVASRNDPEGFYAGYAASYQTQLQTLQYERQRRAAKARAEEAEGHAIQATGVAGESNPNGVAPIVDLARARAFLVQYSVKYWWAIALAVLVAVAVYWYWGGKKR